MAAVKGGDPDPVKFVVNSHWHGDHSGGNENLGKMGAVIFWRRSRVSIPTRSLMHI